MKTLKSKLVNGLKGIYLIFGEDNALADKAWQMIAAKAGTGAGFELFDVTSFNDENFSAKVVTDTCEGLPMGSEKKLVLVKNIAKLKEDDKKIFEAYANNPSPSTCLVVIDTFGVFDFLIAKKAEQVDCKRFSMEELLKIVSVETRRLSKTISEQAAKELIERCNFYYGNITNELKKLAFFDAESQMITKEAVEKSVNKEIEFVIYELTEALSHKDGNRAIELLHLMEKDVGTLSLMTNHFRRVFFAGVSDGTNAEIAKELGVKEYAITKAKQAAKNFSKVSLKKIFELLEEVDYSMKSGKMSQTNCLYYLVFSILSI